METSAQMDGIVERLAHGRRVRVVPPGGGRLQIDRALPFLCIHRRPLDRPDGGTDRLLIGESAFLLCSGDKRLRRDLAQWVQRVIQAQVAQFGTALILELWSEAEGDVAFGPGELQEARPSFTIVTNGSESLHPTVQALEAALVTFRHQRRLSVVKQEVRRERLAPPGMPPLVPHAWLREVGAHYMGLAIRPIFRHVGGGDACEVFPEVLRALRRSLSRALRMGLFEFSRQTTHRPPHFQALGPRSVTRAVYDVDRRLAGICDQFDYLMQATPINTHTAWLEFEKRRFAKNPEFRYRPMTVDPVSLKRRLFAIPLERVEDPALSEIFRQKLDELDRLITLMGDRGTPRFLHGSVQVFGGVEEALLELAVKILRRVSARSREVSRGRQFTAQDIARLASEEMRHYTRQFPDFPATVRVREDLPAGILVSGDEVHLGSRTAIPPWRAHALLQHEVGVHLVTRHNGRQQPFRLLAHGLAGYEAFQEGLAVLAEYLAGGLTRSRLRTLAARVVAVHSCLDGAQFVETYRLLNQTHGVSRQAAWTITMRVYRGGGLTKDAVYLRGLAEVLDYFARGGDLEPLWVGKIAARHVPIVRELRWRKVLTAAAVTPRFLLEQGAKDRLLRLKNGLDVLGLLEQHSAARP